MEYKTWEQENDSLIEGLIDESLWPAINKNELAQVELIITDSCNQKCEYCYLVKYGEELYPSSMRDPENIIKNLDIVLNYIQEKQTGPILLDIFSGEIWSSKLGRSFFIHILQHLEKGLQLSKITIPSNFTFLLDDNTVEFIDDFIDKCSFLYNCQVVFSCSNDGEILENITRPGVSNELTEKKNEEYFEKIYAWCKKHNYGFHPMISAASIEYWPEQIKKWFDVLDKLDFSIMGHIMFLEVRNDEWTDNKIEHYLKYMNTAIDEMVSRYFDNNFELFLNRVYGIDLPGFYNYPAFSLNYSSKNFGCNFDKSLAIRLGDLSICPCHRLSYDKLNYGKFKVENNRIIGVSAANVNLMNFIFSTSGTSKMMKCGNCDFRDFCIKGCYGANFESTKEMFYTPNSVCELFKAKFYFLYKKYSASINIPAFLEKNKSLKKQWEQMEKIFISNKKELSKWDSVINQLI